MQSIVGLTDHVQSASGSLILHPEAERGLAGPNANYSVRKRKGREAKCSLPPSWERVTDRQLSAIKQKEAEEI